MKNMILYLTSTLLLFCTNLSSSERPINSTPVRDSITIFSSPDLFILASRWAEEYNIINPDLKIHVKSVNEKGIGDIKTGANLGFVSQEYYSLLNRESIWKEVIGRDVFVPVINSQNPFLKEINEQGISSQEFVQIFSNSGKMNWGTLVESVQNHTVNYYFIDNKSLNAGIANFLNAEQIIFNGIAVNGREEMVSAVQKDPYAIGFCKLTDILDYKNHRIMENIRLMPIDRNNNGRIDSNEKIYDDLNAFTRGVWIGKYPKALYSNIYTVASSKPTEEIELAFVKWVLTDGQQFIIPTGYCDLAFNERQTKVENLIAGKIDIATPENDKSNLRLVLFIVGALAVSGFLLDVALRYRKNKRVDPSLSGLNPRPVFNENSVDILNGLYFDKTHTWAFMEKTGLVKIGIDDFLQHLTGAITQVKMKNPGEKIKKGEPVFSIIQKGKQLNINSPVSGIIKEKNQLLMCNSALINSSPYSDGWVYMIEPSNWSKEIPFLFMADKYKNWIKNEFSRLKDFLALILKPDTLQYSHVVLQDGGELIDNLLSEMSPQVWEEFQTNFLNTSR